MTSLVMIMLLIALVACSQRAVVPGEELRSTPSGIEIRTLSSSPDLVSAGDSLVQIRLRRERPFNVTVNGLDITKAFSSNRSAETYTYLGLVDGLKLGENEIEVHALEPPTSAFLRLTNYPIQGPMVSGPHLQPFVCQTETFELPDGTHLGKSLDADCSVATKITYLYRSIETHSFKPLPATGPLPADLAKTTTLSGAAVNFIVRVETATINRGIYQSAVLHDPRAEPPPTPTAAPRGWNRRLIGLHGAGCTPGWYVQVGSKEIAVMLRALLLDERRLGEGYALFINTLQNPSTSCNPFVAGETAMMSKEHFIETYGVPHLTLSMGGSGGAYTSLQVIDAFPGIFDGALISATFPDTLSIALSGMDARLLRHYFAKHPIGFSEAQQVGVSGYQGRQAWYDAANAAGRTDAVPSREDTEPYPSAVWNPDVPESLRFDPVKNPKGARPTIWDVAKNIYGTDPQTGFALRVFDNVGVQYGLRALNSGLISRAQFLELNQRIGGYDRDNHFVPDRTVGDSVAVLAAYRSGLQLGGGGGLARVPVVDLSAYMHEEASGHYQWFHFAVRERMRLANGNSANHIMWRDGYVSNSAEGEVVREKAFGLLIDWMEAIQSDQSPLDPREKVLRYKPSALVDGCWAPGAPRFIEEPQTFNDQPNSRCNTLFPSYAFPRFVAGGPLAAHILKCPLKAVDLGDYTVSFTFEEAQRLREIFLAGVCDWTRSDAHFGGVDVNLSYGPAPRKSAVLH